MRRHLIERAVVVLVLGLTESCGESPALESTSSVGSSETTGGSACQTECPGRVGDAADGEACEHDADCCSGLCLQFQDVPADPDAVCVPRPEDCGTHVAGTVFEFPGFAERTPLVDALVAVYGGQGLATDPAGATRYLETMTSDGGRFEGTITMPVDDAIGLVGLVPGDGYPTVTGLADPQSGGGYGPGTDIHELWSVPGLLLGQWSAALESDPDVLPFLPLGQYGGVVGLIRDVETGNPVPGASLVYESGTKIVARYLEPDGTFSPDTTSSEGIFVLVDPELGARIDVEVAGEQITVNPGYVGSASDLVFVWAADVRAP